MSQIIGIGETVLDIIFKNDQPQAAVPGGSTFNALISLGRTGTPCSIITEVGDDHIGDITCKYLRDNGVNDKYIHHPKDTKSHLSLAFLDEKNDAQYEFYKDHKSVSLSNIFPTIDNTDIVLFGSFYAINPKIREGVKSFLEYAHEQGAFLYYDINFRASHINDIPMVIENITENYRLSNVVRGSLEDFRYLYNTDDVSEIYDKYISPYCKTFICTDSNKPIQILTPDKKYEFEVNQIDTISTIGAGDNFNAGFLYKLFRMNLPIDITKINSDDWNMLIHFGQLFSTDVCRQIGNSISKELVDKLPSVH